jgi:hypothetical protein
MAGGAHNSKLIVVVAIAVTGGVIWLGGGTAPEPLATNLDQATPAAPSVPPEPPPPAEPAAPAEPAPAPEQTARVAVADTAGDPAAARAEDVERELARLLYTRGGRAMVNLLTGNGMAPSDGEDIVRRAMDDIAACVIEALRTEAATGSVPLDTLLLALEAVMAETDTPEAVEILKTDTIEANAEACTYAVGQQAGLPIG